MLNTGHSFAGKQALCFRFKFTFLTSAGRQFSAGNAAGVTPKCLCNLTTVEKQAHRPKHPFALVQTRQKKPRDSPQPSLIIGILAYMIEQFSLRVKAKTPPENPLRAKIFSGCRVSSGKVGPCRLSAAFSGKNGFKSERAVMAAMVPACGG
jgi:hypothetical protein